MRVIDDAGNQLGVMPNFEALRMARERGLDLVEVSPHDRPPVCRVMDYGKFKYSQKKKVKKHHEQQLKEVRLRPKTDTHDRSIKVKHAIDFLSDGDKVQFTMKFRGRERSHREIGIEAFESIIRELGPLIKVERAPSMEGRDMIMILIPTKVATDLKAAARAEQAKRDGKAVDAPGAGDKSDGRPGSSDAKAAFGSSLNLPMPPAGTGSPRPTLAVAPAAGQAPPANLDASNVNPANVSPPVRPAASPMSSPAHGDGSSVQ